jgi:hypothetical protein
MDIYATYCYYLSPFSNFSNNQHNNLELSMSVANPGLSMSVTNPGLSQ